jgi:hypothetical protein
MSVPPPIPPAIPQQLTPENLQQLQSARAAMKKIRRAVNAARLEGYSVAIFGAISFVFSIGSVSGMLFSAILTAIGVIEITAASKLVRLDLRAPRILAVNQLALAALILLYALWNIYTEVAHPNADLAGLSPSDIQAMNQLGVSGYIDAGHQIMILVYIGLILAALIEAAMALYYHTRAQHLRQFLNQTPPWIVSMQQAGVSI